MKLKFLVAGLLAATIGHAQPAYNWVNTFGSADFEYISAATSDAAGNVYITGVYNGIVDFDPGPGTQSPPYNGEEKNFICKFDASGNLTWVKSLGTLYTQAITVDVAGNVYTTGNFGRKIDFDPGPGEFDLTPAGIYDIFISKLDATGNFVWAKAMGGTSTEQGKSIAVDAAGNVYTTGTFSGTADFDPGSGTQFLIGGYSFVSKLDASGNYVWAFPYAAQITNAVALDAGGNVYLSGTFFDATADFDPGTGTYNLPYAGDVDVFITQFDASGNFVWAKGMGGADADFVKGLTLDASGNIYITGSFVNAADFDPGPGSTILTTPSNAKDAFVTKLDASGNLVWAKNMGGDDNDEGSSVKVDALGNVYTAGIFENAADFDPNAGTQTLTAPSGNSSLFFSKLNASGNYVWAFAIDGVGDASFPCSIIANGDDNIYAIGDFWDNVDFDPGAGTQNVMSAGDQDIFMVHLAPTTVPLTLLQLQAENNDNSVLVHWVTTQEDNTASFSIERSADGHQYTAIGSVPAANTAFKNSYAFTDARPLNGTGFYRLKMIDLDGKYTYSPIVSARRNENGIALLVSPNPAKDLLYVQAKGSEPVTIQITDVNGRILQQQKVSLNGNTSFSVNIQSLPAGSYYLILKGRKTNQVQQFLKQ